jgi:transcriptional regulator of met regulon
VSLSRSVADTRFTKRVWRTQHCEQLRRREIVLFNSTLKAIDVADKRQIRKQFNKIRHRSNVELLID